MEQVEQGTLEYAYNGAYVVGLGPKISNERVLDIIHSHQGFRENYPESELMSDEEFLREYLKIIQVPERGIVPGDMAGRIEMLRARYEKLPLKPNSRYNQATVRIQTSKGKFRPVPKEEMQKIFVGKLERVNRYWVEDILNVSLGRWSTPVGAKPLKKKRKYVRKEQRPSAEKRRRVHKKGNVLISA